MQCDEKKCDQCTCCCKMCDRTMSEFGNWKENVLQFSSLHICKIYSFFYKIIFGSSFKRIKRGSPQNSIIYEIIKINTIFTKMDNWSTKLVPQRRSVAKCKFMPAAIVDLFLHHLLLLASGLLWHLRPPLHSHCWPSTRLWSEALMCRHRCLTSFRRRRRSPCPPSSFRHQFRHSFGANFPPIAACVSCRQQYMETVCGKIASNHVECSCSTECRWPAEILEGKERKKKTNVIEYWMSRNFKF